MTLHTAITLHDARSGQEVLVRCILFDTLRQECERLGVRAGRRIRVKRCTESHVSVAVPGERVVRLRRDWVRFIEIEPLTPAAS